jgi:hypothetical protein
MSKLPQLNLRVPEDYHQIIRDIAQRFRESSAPSFALDLAAWMRGQPQPVQAPDLAVRLAEVEGQLLILEARLAKLEAPPAAPTKRLTKGMVKSSLQKI